eukprot:COSAG06_NODE_3639_length_5087_cov_1.558741_2_plen_314_part_00
MPFRGSFALYGCFTRTSSGLRHGNDSFSHENTRRILGTKTDKLGSNALKEHSQKRTYVLFTHRIHNLQLMEMIALEATCGNQYTLPRLMGLSEDGDEIRLLPLPALLHLRLLPPSPATASHVVMSAAQLLAAGRTVSTVKGAVLHLNALLPCALAAHASFFGVHLLSGANETTLVGWDSRTERVTIDRSMTSAQGVGQTAPMTAKLKGGCPVGEQLNLTAVIDGGILEVYANDRFAITTALWPTESISPESREVGLVVARGAREGDGRRRDGDGDGGGGEAEAYDAAAGAGGAALSVWKLQTAGVLHPPKPYG